MAESPKPNPLAVAWSVLRALRLRRPAPAGSGTTHHDELGRVLDALRRGGVGAVVPLRDQLAEYRDRLSGIDPDSLTRPEALAYWINLYNAGAIDLAADGLSRSTESVLRIPGGFARTWVRVAGEALSLDGIEHGKIRRFKDPRIHGALVCGSASCPTLAYEPFTGSRIDVQLDAQMRTFLAAGGLVANEAPNTLRLSRIFLWYGADFVRPHRMPTWLPVRRSTVAEGLQPWLPDDLRRWVETAQPTVEFQDYDWSLACSVGFISPAESDDH